MPALNPKNGYTLVELLVVIAIMGLLSITSVVYYKSLSSDKEILKAIDSVQSLLRTAQSNATSGFNCETTPGGSKWFILFKDNKTQIDLDCVDMGSGTPVNRNIRTLNLEDNIQIDTVCCSSGADCSSSVALPIYVSYSPLYGKVEFGPKENDNCLVSKNYLIVTLKKNNSNSCTENPSLCKFTISKGGAINAK